MKTLLVTGASRGLGFEICKKASADGHRAIALSRNISPLMGIPNVHPFSVDLSIESEVVDFVKEIIFLIKQAVNGKSTLISQGFIGIGK